jgi:methionyl-tRNA formyltransferase
MAVEDKPGRAVFMGTPGYAVPALDVLGRRGWEVLVVTRPDRPVGRRRELRPSPVRERAEQWGFPVLTPSRVGPRTAARLAAFRPDLLFTAAYGLILSPAVLAIAPSGAYNLHASLLPRWRGANPVAWAIRAGDVETGVTLMAMDAGVDTGPVVAAEAEPIREDDTTGTLTDRLARVAAKLLASWLDALRSGHAPRHPQEGTPTWAPKFQPGEERVDWHRPAVAVSCHVRSMLPEPGPYTTVDGERIRLLEVRVGDGERSEGPPGTVVTRGEEWHVACAPGTLVVGRIQPAGRRAMSPGAYQRGRRRPVSRAE